MKNSKLIEMNSQFFPGGKILFTVENGYVSGKQLLDALGLRSRVLLSKIPQDAPTVKLETTPKPSSVGYLPITLVQALKSLKLGSVKNPDAVKFVIDMLPIAASESYAQKVLKSAKEKAKNKPEPPSIIDLDRKPLQPEDIFRRDASLTRLQGDDINAILQAGTATLYDFEGKSKVEFLNLDIYDGTFRSIQRGLNLLTVREAAEKYPDKLVFDTRKPVDKLNWVESQKQGKLVFDRLWDFDVPQPWVTPELIVKAENLRSQREREEYELRKKKMLEDAQKKLKEESKNVHDKTK